MKKPKFLENKDRKSKPLKCEVCGIPAHKVMASRIAPVSIAYCDECLEEGIEPYRILVLTASLEGGFDRFKGLVERSLKKENKSMEQFLRDVEKWDRRRL